MFAVSHTPGSEVEFKCASTARANGKNGRAACCISKRYGWLHSTYRRGFYALTSLSSYSNNRIFTTLTSKVLNGVMDDATVPRQMFRSRNIHPQTHPHFSSLYHSKLFEFFLPALNIY